MKSVFTRARRVHFVGIGGVGMSGIAEVLLTLGHQVSGSDLQESEITRHLAALGADIALGHDEERITPGIDVVVISSAVKFANLEVVRARVLKIPVIPRAEMLAELMRLKTGVAVAGTHGKTTTTSLIATILGRAGFDPTIVIGGRLRSAGSSARLGQGELMVAEADESDGTFLLLSPTIAVVTNMDPEHLDYYGDMDRVRTAYLEFVNRVPFYGISVLCLDHVNVRAMLPRVRKRTVTYGTTADADYVAADLSVDGMDTRFTVRRGDTELGELRLPLPGRHQALNALAALAVADQFDVPFETVREALGEFGGIHRRFELCGRAQGISVISDYGHHPAEIQATLAAAREGFRGRLVAVFQPHRYTRTRDLFSDFLGAFDAADLLVLTDIYAAGEDAIEGLDGEVLYWALKRRGHLEVSYVPQLEDVVVHLRPQLRAGDVVLVLGAGSIHGIGAQLVQSLAGTEASWTVQ